MMTILYLVQTLANLYIIFLFNCPEICHSREKPKEHLYTCFAFQKLHFFSNMKNEQKDFQLSNAKKKDHWLLIPQKFLVGLALVLQEHLQGKPPATTLQLLPKHTNP